MGTSLVYRIFSRLAHRGPVSPPLVWRGGVRGGDRSGETPQPIGLLFAPPPRFAPPSPSKGGEKNSGSTPVRFDAGCGAHIFDVCVGAGLRRHDGGSEWLSR